jgi:hypothetical protein
VTGPPLRDWLERTGRPLAPRGAAFDTRAAKPAMLTGSAARGIARRMRRMGYVVAGEESFMVEGTDGPLREGELERARAWGASLVGASAGAGAGAASPAGAGV